MADELLDGRYRLEDVLGSGAMGIVRAAADLRLDRRVAIKLLADNLALDEVARERFEREARSAARVAHPHVVTVHDVGAGDVPGGGERPYIVMELVEGGSLRDHLIDHGVLAPDEVADIAGQALAGLGAAHRVGLLHRDMKPANLLRDRDGVIKLTDFGIAHAGEQPGLTRTGYILGSLAYLAPERLRGEPASASTDLYGLAATLVELLQGRPRERDEPLQLPAGTPGGLRRLIERCLAIEPARRPQDADAALALLRGDVADDVADPRPEAADVATVEARRQDAPTEVLRPTATLAVGAQSGDEAGDRARRHGEPPPGRSTASDGRRSWWRRPALVAAAVVAVALLTTLVFADGDTPSEPPAEPSPLVEEAEELRDRVNDLLGR